MRIPAIRSKIGTWTYYVTTLTFEQISQTVSKVDEHLHQSDSLSDLIQRSITNNYLSIKDYVLNQPDVFFNSLVLAVYDDYPQWKEIEFKYEDDTTYTMGLLEFPGNHKIFPVDGQHRVEGIKAALQDNPELRHEKIAAIFIGHKNDEEGRQKTRRLFTTLNRYAKPVKDDDIIALDEDDIAAITTRYLLEEYDLFTDKRVVYAKQKAIPSNNRDAITSIITLYQANCVLLKLWHVNYHSSKLTARKFIEFLKFRRPEVEITSFQDFCKDYWNQFKILSVVSRYLAYEINAAEPFRRNDNGGNLIFRPIGFLPLVQASAIVRDRTNATWQHIFSRFEEINMNLDQRPWINILWNPVEHKMIMSSGSLTILMLIYLYNPNILNTQELLKLKNGYAARINYEGDINNVLEEII
ncbi:MAG TPA: DNA sulfur modification protein DndB [Sphingobacteriaceae bacterium]